MFNTERFCNSILLGMTFCLISCEAFVDEMRIRSDPNTIVKPDWNELEAIEKAEGTYLGDEPVQVIQPPPVVKVQEANPGMRRIEKNYSPIVSPAIRPQAMIPQAMVPEASASYANPQPRPGSAYPSSGGASYAAPAPYPAESRPSGFRSQAPQAPQYDPSLLNELQ